MSYEYSGAVTREKFKSLGVVEKKSTLAGKIATCSLKTRGEKMFSSLKRLIKYVTKNCITTLI